MCRENYDSLKANVLVFVLLFQPPCCSPDQGSCGLSEVCKDCTTVFYSYDLIELITIVCYSPQHLWWWLVKFCSFMVVQCFRHADLSSDRPSTTQFKEKLPWFLNALPSADCAKGGHGAYSSSVDLQGFCTVPSLFLNPFYSHRFCHCRYPVWYMYVQFSYQAMKMVSFKLHRSALITHPLTSRYFAIS